MGRIKKNITNDNNISLEDKNVESKTNNPSLLELGNIFITKEISHHININNYDKLTYCLSRHSRGDWGKVCKEEALINDNALLEQSSILSIYEIDSQIIWIITEADRRTTTVLFPIEY